MEQELKANLSIEKRVNRAYEFADLSDYSFKDRLLIRAADLAFYFLISLIGRTARFEVTGWENHRQVEVDGGLPIYVFWHDRIFLTTYWWRKRRIVVMTSRSFDGEYIARFIQRFGYGAVRGSSTRGGVGAVVEMARLMLSMDRYPWFRRRVLHALAADPELFPKFLAIHVGALRPLDFGVAGAASLAWQFLAA